MTCQLVGGPFDGDCGDVQIDPLPPMVWVWACGEEGDDCPFGGIHWQNQAVRDELQPERYRIGPRRERAGAWVQLYLHADLGLESPDSEDAKVDVPEEVHA